jgi:hypothetical protein
MQLNQKNIFLLDGTGATLSAAFTGLILPRLSEWTGIPWLVLSQLVLLPLFFGGFSFGCYFFVSTAKRWMLWAVIFANLFYCLISISIVFLLEGLTTFGISLLLIEVLVILAVVWLEWIVVRKEFS